MHLYPASLLLSAAVLWPNMVSLAFPPLNIKQFGSPDDSRTLTVIERIGQVSCFLLPIFFRLSFSGTLVLIAWAILGLSLALYYAGWIRYYSRGRDYAFLFKPLMGIPVPMAASPVLYFFLASFILGSWCQAAAAVVLAIGHLTITARESVRVKRIAAGSSS